MAEAPLPGLSISPDALDILSDALGSSTASPSLEDARESGGITSASLSGALRDDLGLSVPDPPCVKKLSTGSDGSLSIEPYIGGKCSGSALGASKTALPDCIKSSTQHEIDNDNQSQILSDANVALPLKEGLSLSNSVEINSIKETKNILENNTDVYINHVDCTIAGSVVSNTVNKSTDEASNDGSDCLSTKDLRGVQSSPETELTSDMLEEKESIGPSDTNTQQSLFTFSDLQGSKCSNSKNLKCSSTCSPLVGCSSAEPDFCCHNFGSVDATSSQGLCAKDNNRKCNKDKNQSNLDVTRYKETAASVCVPIVADPTCSETLLTPGQQTNCNVSKNIQADDLLIPKITSTKDSSSADKSSFSDSELLDKKINSIGNSNADTLNFKDVTIEPLNEIKSLESLLSCSEPEQNSELACPSVQVNFDDAVLSKTDSVKAGSSNEEVPVHTNKYNNESKMSVAENVTGKNELIEKCRPDKNYECTGFSDASNLTVCLQVDKDRLDKLKNSGVGITRNLQVVCDSKSIVGTPSKQEEIPDTNINETDFCSTKHSAEEQNLENNLHLTDCNKGDSLNCKEVADIGEQVSTDNITQDVIEGKLNSFEFGLNLLSKENKIINTPELMSTDAKDTTVSEDGFTGCLMETEKAETSSLCNASIDNTVVMQTVVEGVLQPLDVSNLDGSCSVQSVMETSSSHDNGELFAGVEEPTSLANSNAAMHVLETSADEADGISGLVINSVVGRFGEVVEEVLDGEDTREFADISGTPYLPVDKESDVCTGNPRAKRPRLEVPESDPFQPVIIKVKPVKGDFGFWDSDKLRAVIAEKGTILLRLCATDPLVGQEYDSTSDFVGVMLESEEDGIYGMTGHPGDSGGGHEPFPISMDGEYQSHYNPYMYHSKTPDGAEEDFVETEEVEECLDYDAATAQSLNWQGKCCSSAQRRAMPPPPAPPPLYYSSSNGSPPFRGNGKRNHGMRGRPPLHRRSVYMMPPQQTPQSYTKGHHYYSPPPPQPSPSPHFVMPPHALQTPPLSHSATTKVKLAIHRLGSDSSSGSSKPKNTGILFRPPTPPRSDDNKYVSSLAGALRRCSSLLSIRRPAPGSILSQQMKLQYKEECDSGTSSDSKSSSSKSKPQPLQKHERIYCDFCPTRFRKKTSLFAHIKHKHRFMKKCPICNVGVRVKGEYNMKFHILKNHKEMNTFACGDCGAVFKLQHHLKNHLRLGCEPEVKPEPEAEPLIVEEPLKLTAADILVPEEHGELELLGSLPGQEGVEENDEEEKRILMEEEGYLGEDGLCDNVSNDAHVDRPRPGKRKRRSKVVDSDSDIDDKSKDKSYRVKISKLDCTPSRTTRIKKRRSTEIQGDVFSDGSCENELLTVEEIKKNYAAEKGILVSEEINENMPSVEHVKKVLFTSSNNSTESCVAFNNSHKDLNNCDTNLDTSKKDNLRVNKQTYPASNKNCSISTAELANHSENDRQQSVTAYQNKAQINANSNGKKKQMQKHRTLTSGDSDSDHSLTGKVFKLEDDGFIRSASKACSVNINRVTSKGKNNDLGKSSKERESDSESHESDGEKRLVSQPELKAGPVRKKRKLSGRQRLLNATNKSSCMSEESDANSAFSDREKHNKQPMPKRRGRSSSIQEMPDKDQQEEGIANCKEDECTIDCTKPEPCPNDSESDHHHSETDADVGDSNELECKGNSVKSKKTQSNSKRKFLRKYSLDSETHSEVSEVDSKVINFSESKNSKNVFTKKSLLSSGGRIVSSDSGSESDAESSESEIEERKKVFCSMCDAGFSHVFKLKHHLKLVHNGIPKEIKNSARNVIKNVIHKQIQNSGKTESKICKSDNKKRVKKRNQRFTEKDIDSFSQNDAECGASKINQGSSQKENNSCKNEFLNFTENKGKNRAENCRHLTVEGSSKCSQKSVDNLVKVGMELDEDKSSEDHLKCSKCNKKCRNECLLKLHMQSHTVKSKCKINLKQASSRNHSDSRRSDSDNAQEEATVVEQEVETSCLAKVNSESSYTDEKESADCQTTNQYDSADSSSLNQLPSYIVKKASLYICTQCSLTFKREKSVVYHMKKIHETLYPFKACPHCRRVFRSCGPYYKHVKQHQVRLCVVEGCKGRFRNTRRLKQHQKGAHEEYPFRCPHCEHLYKVKKELEEHCKVMHFKEEEDDEDASEGEQQEDVEEEVQVDEQLKPSEEKNKSMLDKMDLANLPDKRKTRTELSYREDDEEDLVGIRKKRFPFSNKSPFKRNNLSPKARRAVKVGYKKIGEVERLTRTDFDIFKPCDIELDRGSRRKLSEEHQQPLVVPKKKVIKKKPDKSWTAALKARIKAEARAAAAAPAETAPAEAAVRVVLSPVSSPSPTKAGRPKKSPKTPVNPKSLTNPKSSSNPKLPSVRKINKPRVLKSPPAPVEPVKPPSPSEMIANENLAALVVRRVAETLASQQVADLKVPTPEVAPPSHKSHLHPYQYAGYPPGYPPYPANHPYYSGHHPPTLPHHVPRASPHQPPYPVAHHLTSVFPYHHQQHHYLHHQHQPPYGGSEDSCSSLDTPQESRPGSPNKVLRFDNF